jgi:hypothetical protein
VLLGVGAVCLTGWQPLDPLLASRTERRDDLVIDEPCRDRIERERQLACIDSEAREHAARFQHAQAALEGLLRAERLDCDVHATALGAPHDLGNRVGLPEVDGDIGAESPARSCSTSGAMINSTAITTADPALHVFPREP